jgi:8-oxo-dGTP pyrophosphatase MutT (NUDIX family)
VLPVGIPDIRKKLAGREPRKYLGEAGRRAAVAAILRPGPHDTEVLLIRRAEREDDPWSGHIAFPGGHQDRGDLDLLATARRETLEEAGLELPDSALIAALDDHPATARGRFTGMVIAPYLFAIEGDPPLRPNHEVAELIWAPLGAMARGELDAVHELSREGHRMRFPGFAVGDHVVWGLTHRMLQSLFDVLRAHG